MTPLRAARVAAHALLRTRASAAQQGARSVVAPAAAAALAAASASAAARRGPSRGLVGGSSGSLLFRAAAASAPVDAPAGEDQQQQQKKQQQQQKQGGGKKGGKKGGGAAPAAADGDAAAAGGTMTLEEMAAIDLPTSDESEELLRVRHTVSLGGGVWRFFNPGRTLGRVLALLDKRVRGRLLLFFFFERPLPLADASSLAPALEGQKKTRPRNPPPKKTKKTVRPPDGHGRAKALPQDPGDHRPLDRPRLLLRL
jgi:hypothetical protein